MRAITFTDYGGPEVLKLSQQDKPTPKDKEVLIKIYATAVNTADCRFRRADPWLIRLFLGLFKPKPNTVLGGVFSGVIEAVGKDVSKHQVGDQVFGSTGLSLGAYGEYKCLPENGIFTVKPANLTHAEASTIGFGGLTALYFVQKAALQPGQKVLVYGASGSVGTSIVQLARYYGAEVTAVCSTKNIELVKSLGASHAIDYTKEDFAQNGIKYDAIFETVNKTSLKTGLKSLKESGALFLIAASFGDMLKGAWISLTSQTKIVSGTFAEKTENLEFLKKLIETGDLKAVVDKTYNLEQMVEAHTYVETGHKVGNVAVLVCDEK